MIGEPIRILHVFGRLDRGGAETMIMNLYRNIDRSKIQFDFIMHTEDNCDYVEEIRILGGKIYSIPKFTGKNFYDYIRRWSIFFKQHKEYKIVHGHMRSTAAIYLKIAKRCGLITIAHSHSISSGKGVSAFVKNVMQIPIRFVSDYLFACSIEAGEWLFGKKSLYNNKFYLLKNAIDIKQYTLDVEKGLKIREDFGIAEKFIVGHVGRFSYPKNHDFLIDIFNEIHKIDDNSVLMLVGEGELREEIQIKLSKLGLLQNVIFTGARDDVYNFFQAMDVFVFPSHYEGLGMVAIEAQAAGVPCIVADTIPKEIFVTNKIKELSLEDTPKKWAEIILDEKQNRYKDINDHSKLNEYDVRKTVKWIEKFYLGVK